MRAILVTSIAVATAAALAQVPNKIGYQGRLLRPDGSPESGVVQMTFTLHDSVVGGNALGCDATAVALTDGFYSLHLGSLGNCLGTTAAIEPAIFDGRDLWLEVSVGVNVMSPRQRIGTVPYAHRAGVARDVRGGTVEATSMNVGGAGGVSVTSSGISLGATTVVDGSGKATVATGAGLTGNGNTATPVAVAPNGVTGALLASDAASLSKVSAGAMSSAGGLVGVGTAAPANPLHVNALNGGAPARLKLDTGGGGNTFTIDVAQGSGLTNLVAGAEINAAGSGYNYLGSRGASRIALHDGTIDLQVGGTTGTAGSPVTFLSAVAVSSAGNVGIGATPTEKLEVAGRVKVTGAGNGIVFPDGSVQTTAGAGRRVWSGTALSGSTVNLAAAAFTAAPSVLLSAAPGHFAFPAQVSATSFRAIASAYEPPVLWSIRQGQIYAIGTRREVIRQFNEPGAAAIHSGITYDTANQTIWILRQSPGGQMTQLTILGTVLNTVAVPADVADMIKYDPSDDTFWVTGAANFVDHLNRSGGSLGRFALTAVTSVRGVSVDPIDNSLWLIDESGTDTLLHTSRTGAVLGSTSLTALPDAIVDVVRMEDGTFWMSNQGANLELLHVSADASVILYRIPVGVFGQSNPIGLDVQRPRAVVGIPLAYVAVGN